MIFFLSLPFMAGAHVNLLYPQGGEEFEVGEIVTIEWEVLIMHNTLNWDLYFSPNGGESWDVIEMDVPYENLSYEWTVPNSPTDAGMVRVVQDNQGTDYSDQSGTFAISGTTGVDDTKTVFLNIYPNPATDYLYIQPENSTGKRITVMLWSNAGQLLRSVTAAKSFKPENHIIDLSGLAPGIYLLGWDGEGFSGRKKIVVAGGT